MSNQRTNTISHLKLSCRGMPFTPNPVQNLRLSVTSVFRNPHLRNSEKRGRPHLARRGERWPTQVTTIAIDSNGNYLNVGLHEKTGRIWRKLTMIYSMLISSGWYLVYFDICEDSYVKIFLPQLDDFCFTGFIKRGKASNKPPMQAESVFFPAHIGILGIFLDKLAYKSCWHPHLGDRKCYIIYKPMIHILSWCSPLKKMIHHHISWFIKPMNYSYP
jgi:hypothetical protein